MLSKTIAAKASSRSRRQALLTGAAIALAMTAMARSPRAHAQAFQGTPTVTMGSVNIIAEGTGTLLTVNTTQASINWAPTDTAIGGGPIAFLPNGRTATFENSANISDFVVLNRIVPADATRGIRLDGTVLGRVTDGQGVTRTGGAIWFFSPGGIIAGPNAVFDVGSLLLTTNDIDITGGLFGDTVPSTRGTIRFRGASGSLSAVEIQAGAQITARNQALNNAYVAVVAPRIIQRGTIDTRGSTALVAAEAADITINFGNLFDINMITGTSGGTAIDHSGVTTGPAGGFGANNTVYLTTIAKNDAVSMLVGGTLGYTPASSATVDNFGTVILSAGYDVGIAGGTAAIAATPDNANAADISIRNGLFTSNVVAHASNDLIASPSGAGGSITFARDATLSGDARVNFGVESNERISVDGDLSIVSRRPGQGGNATVYSSLLVETGYGATSVTVGGDLTIDTSAFGADDLSPTGVGQSATGGNAMLRVEGGSIDIGGNADVRADGNPGLGTVRSGNGAGGSARIVVNGGGIDVGTTGVANTGNIFVSASGQSADRNGFFFRTLHGGNGTGGLAEIAVLSGSLAAIEASVLASASGSTGGYVNQNGVANGSGGSATGGAARIHVDSEGTATLTSAGVSTFAEAGGVFFESQGGAATGGQASITADAGSLTVTSDLSINADAFATGGSSAGEANGGTVTLTAISGGTIDTGSASLGASAFGDFGENAGGAAFGGSITIGAENGDLSLGNLFVTAFANGGGSSVEGGAAIGGTVTLFSRAGGDFDVTGGTNVQANASTDSADFAGDADGGIIRITATDGSIQFGDPQDSESDSVFLSASGEAGLSFEGESASGAGGSIEITTLAGAQNSASISFRNLIASANGFGPGSVTGDGTGLGSGGEVRVTVSGGTMTGHSLDIEADGNGNDGGEGGFAGNGAGGIAAVLVDGGAASFEFLSVNADGDGGFGVSNFFGDPDAASGAGGEGIGGEASVIATSGSLSVNQLSINARGEGGEGGFGFDIGGGAGGDGFGGTATFRVSETANVTINSLSVTAFGEGGEGGVVGYFDDGGEGCGFECGYGPGNVTFDDDGGIGGDGFGGDALIDVAEGTGTLSINFAEADASGDGGEGGFIGFFFSEEFDPEGTGVGGAGGNGTGGSATVRVARGTDALSFVNVEADGDGGDGGEGFAGGAGGIGTGGTASFLATDAIVTIQSLDIQAGGDGGFGADGFSRAGGAGGAAQGGNVQITAQGLDASLTLSNLSLNVDAEGGDGGDGGEEFTLEIGATGGKGGDATGGTGEILADLGDVILETGYGQGFVDISSTGTGGEGGFGGNGSNTGVSGGLGGDGGNGFGGTLRLRADGGLINMGDLTLRADGIGAEGGGGGFGPFDPGNPEAEPPIPPSGPFRSPDGALGLGTGGVAEIVATDRSAEALGTIALGNTYLSASGLNAFSSSDGNVAGRIKISLDGAGSISFQTLVVEAFGLAPTQAAGSFFFFGMLDDPDGVLLFNFATSSDSTVTLRTYSYAGGTNAAGQQIVSGGFDPILALFDASGQLIDQNDDGGANVPADPVTGSRYDTFLQRDVTAGNYQVSVTAFSNFANGPNLSDGFEGGGSFDDRTQQFAFEVLGASSSSGPGGAIPSFQLIANGPGSISVGGDANIDVGGDASFRIDRPTDLAAGGFSVGGSLTVNSAGSITVDAIESGSVIADGSIFFDADNAVNITHAARSDAVSTLEANDIEIFANGDIVTSPGSALLADNSIELLSFGGSISAARLLASDQILVRAFGDVRIGDAIADGPVVPGEFTAPASSRVQIEAGFNNFSEGGSFVPADAIVSGMVSATGTVRINAGRDVIVENGGQVLSDNRIEISSGDDILVRAGGVVRAAADPIEDFTDTDGPAEAGAPGQLLFEAGRLSVTGLPTDEVASIIVDGTIAAPRRPLGLRAEAIQVDANAIDARSLHINIDNAPTPGTGSNDGGQLRGDCVQGNVCLGNVTGSFRTLSIGDEGRPNDVRLAGGFEGISVAIHANRDIYLGRDDETFALTIIPATATGETAGTIGSESLLLDASEGSIFLLGNYTVSAGTSPRVGDEGVFAIVAGQDVIGANARFVSQTGIDFAVGDDLSVARIDVASPINTIDADGAIVTAGRLSVGGDVTISDLIRVRAGNLDVNAGGNLTIARAEALGNLFLNAGLDATVTRAVAGGGSGGQSATFVVQANANSAFGGTPLDSFAVIQGETIVVESSTNDLWSAGPLPRFSDGNGLVATRIATAADDSGQAPGTQIGASFGALGDGNFAAPFGALVGEVGGTRILLGANGEVVAPASGTLKLNYWDSNAGDNSGSISFALSTGTPPPVGSGFIRINAGGNLNVGTAIAGGDIDLNAGSNATAGTLRAGLDIDINAGDTTLITSATAGGDIFANAGESLTADSLTAGYAIRASAGDDVTIGSATTLGLIGNGGFHDDDISVFAGGAITLDEADSAGSIFLDGGSVDAGDLIADESIDIFANGTVDVVSAVTRGIGSENGYGEYGYGSGGEGSFDGFDISIDAGDSVNVGSADAAGSFELISGGDVDVETVRARGVEDGSGDVTGNIGIGAEGNAAVGSADAARDIGIASLTGNVDAGSLTAVSDILVLADGDIELGTATASRLVYLGGPGFIDFATGGEGFGFDGFEDFDDFIGDEFVGSTPISADGSINVTGLITAGDLIAGADEGITMVSTDVARTADFRSVDGAITVTTDLGVDGVVSAFGEAINFRSLGALTIDSATATNGDIDVVAAQNLTVDEMESDGDIRLTSTAASVFLDDVTTQPRNQDDGFQSGTAIDPETGNSAGNPGPGDIIVDAAVDIVARQDVDARRNLSFDAGRRIDIGSDVHGTTISFVSADIDIDDEVGQVGRSTTTTMIRFANSAAGTRTFIGGTGTTQGGYQLRNNELARVFGGGDIAIAGAALPSSTGGDADVVLGTMTINGQTGTGERAGKIANGGRFTVDSPGAIVIAGDVDFTGLNDQAKVELDANQAIRLNAETGSLSIRGAGNTLAGELVLTSNMIIAGSADAIADIAAAASTDAINDRLGQSEGTASDDGFFAARGMRVDASSGFFVQNSGVNGGSFGDRRGLTVGAGGLRIGTAAPSTRIVINGRQMNADGSFTTGVDFISRVNFATSESGTAQFDPRSTINGCLITGAQCGQVVEPEPEPIRFDPAPSTRDIVDLADEAGEPGEGTLFPTTLLTLADFQGFGFDPLIDEPVTGAGNDDFWITPDDQNEEEDEDEDCTDAAGNKVPCPR